MQHIYLMGAIYNESESLISNWYVYFLVMPYLFGEFYVFYLNYHIMLL